MKRSMVREKANGDWCQVDVMLSDSGELSISGSAGGRRGGGGSERYMCIDGKTRRLTTCGQICEEIRRFYPDVAPNLKWHLNHMNAGCEHQDLAGWKSLPIDPSKPTDVYGFHYEGQRTPSWNMLVWVTRKEHPRGLLSELCPVCGYRYGSAWTKRELPSDVVAWANSFGLPNGSDI